MTSCACQSLTPYNPIMRPRHCAGRPHHVAPRHVTPSPGPEHRPASGPGRSEVPQHSATYTPNKTRDRLRKRRQRCKRNHSYEEAMVFGASAEQSQLHDPDVRLSCDKPIHLSTVSLTVSNSSVCGCRTTVLIHLSQHERAITQR